MLPVAVGGQCLWACLSEWASGLEPPVQCLPADDTDCSPVSRTSTCKQALRAIIMAVSTSKRQQRGAYHCWGEGQSKPHVNWRHTLIKRQVDRLTVTAKIKNVSCIRHGSTLISGLDFAECSSHVRVEYQLVLQAILDLQFPFRYVQIDLTIFIGIWDWTLAGFQFQKACRKQPSL